MCAGPTSIGSRCRDARIFRPVIRTPPNPRDVLAVWPMTTTAVQHARGVNRTLLALTCSPLGARLSALGKASAPRRPSRRSPRRFLQLAELLPSPWRPRAAARCASQSCVPASASSELGGTSEREGVASRALGLPRRRCWGRWLRCDRVKATPPAKRRALEEFEARWRDFVRQPTIREGPACAGRRAAQRVRDPSVGVERRGEARGPDSSFMTAMASWTTASAASRKAVAASPIFAGVRICAAFNVSNAVRSRAIDLGDVRAARLIAHTVAFGFATPATVLASSLRPCSRRRAAIALRRATNASSGTV